ncbi:DUF3152 domain-containing protein [Streptomyces sp. NPDC049881]|uniref:DUF3152 domain-containing protein n=1 Tax=unclassified Streptomyces TaxID=2593676 RepID=UPI003445FC2E
MPRRAPLPPLAPTQRRRRRRARRSRRAVPLRALTLTVLIAGLAVAAVVFLRGGNAPARAQENASPTAVPTTEPSARAEEPPPPEEPTPEEETPSEEPASDPAADQAADVPENGPGTFTTAPGGGDPVGGQAVLAYRVEIEDGIALDPAGTAAEVHDILGNPRGWTNEGDTGFDTAPDGATPDFTVRIATPGTVDALCGEYGLNTRGETNCSIGQVVVVNLRRWVEGSPQFDGPIEEYRALIINHEVGHFLGHGHETCPAEGAPAPAMQQQIMGLHGCVANAWPYDEDGRYISGPQVP